MTEEKIIFILRCHDCKTELNRTEEMTREQAARAAVTSAFAAGKCPKGCRSTFSDLNLNTDIERILVPGKAEEKKA